MKVLLTKDVYKLGRAGDIKRVADGYGRNFLIPQGLALLATPGAIKQAEVIRTAASTQRTQLNKELGGVSERVNGMLIGFPMRAGETGKLYGSITPQMVADSINKKAGTQIDRRQIEIQPIRTLGEFKAHVRMTVDLIPEVSILVYREGDSPAQLREQAPAPAEESAETTVEAPAEEPVQEAETPAEEQAE